MKATQFLHERGQSLWLDNISRELLDSNRLKQYFEDLSITGLTSNPTTFDHAIKSGATYDTRIANNMSGAFSSEAPFLDLAIEDLTRAADLFRPIHEGEMGLTDGSGW